MDQEGITQQETKKEDPELREPSPQPNLNSYYRFIEGGKVIPHSFVIPLLELEKEGVRTHRWMQISKSKGMEDVGHMKEKLKEMVRVLRNIRDIVEMMKSHLEAENAWIRGHLKEGEI